MKTGWICLALWPIAAMSAQYEEDFFYTADESNQTAYHIDFDAEEDYEKKLTEIIGPLAVSEDIDREKFSLLEVDERDESLLPWAIEGFVDEEISSYVDRKSKEVTEEFDDVFANDIPTCGSGNVFEPTCEKLPEERRNLFGRPRVAFSKEDTQQSDENRSEKKTSPSQKQLIIKGPNNKDCDKIK